MMACKYCSDNKTIIKFDEPKIEGYVYVENIELVVSNIYGMTVSTIKFCPMCGEKLKDCLSND